VTIAVEAVGSESVGNGVTSIEVTPPTVSDDQLMLLFASYSDNALTPRVNEAGWALVGSMAGVADTDQSLAVWSKVAASESGTYTVDTNEAVSVAIRGIIAVFSGVHADIVDQTAVDGPDTANSATYDPAAIVTQTANAVVISAISASGGTNVAFTQPSGYTSLFAHTAAAVPFMDAAYKLVASPVSEDPGTWNVTTAVRDTIGITLALKAVNLVKTLKLLAEASAASAASIEGVVLNATRDTVIGEFTGQAFEAALEGGEAVLLIDVADITPNGSTLTTSDTPLVFAYNATDSIIGPGSATVVEL
jgi:hypothetical protein